MSNVALKWVLDQKTVAGVIVGARFGYSQHLEDNHRVFSFSLDEDDYKQISAVQVRYYYRYITRVLWNFIKIQNSDYAAKESKPYDRLR